MVDVGGLMQQLGVMVQEQAERIRRIDENVDASYDHVHEGKEQLDKYYRSLRSNRALLLKVFVVLFFFIIVWGALFA